jgi:ATP/maltotriose-dependent transcriptional regulator MalT
MRVRRLLADLANLVQARGARRRDDLLRVAVWRLDSDTADDPAQLLTACRQAFATYDMPLAARLGRAALDAGGGFDAAEALATILMFAERPRETLALLDSATSLITADDQRSRWLGVRGITTYWFLGDEATPDRLAAAAAELPDPRDRGWVRAIESIMRLHHGEYATADELARSVLTGPAAAAGPLALARSTLAHLSAARGAPVQTIRAMTEVEAQARLWQAETPYIQLAVELARGTAMILAGDFAAVDATVAAGFAGLADAGDFRLGSGYLTLVRSQAARLRSRLSEAARAASQASAILAENPVFAALAHAERAHVAALAGDAAAATAALAESDAAAAPTMRVLYPWLEQARAWVAVAAGNQPYAVAVLGNLVDRLRTDGFAGHEVFACHDLVRLGHAKEVADRLAELSETVEGALPAAMARHARAAADDDGARLLAVAEEFADLDAVLFAAEAAAAAVTLLRGTRAAGTQVAANLLADLLVRCEGARTPALAVPQPTLTGRERQIARLAASGVPSKEIADQLFLSARTVDNHLLRVYQKLGVNGRAELPGALRTLPADE